MAGSRLERPFGDSLGTEPRQNVRTDRRSTTQASVRPVAPPASPEKAGNDSKARARIGAIRSSSKTGAHRMGLQNGCSRRDDSRWLPVPAVTGSGFEAVQASQADSTTMPYRCCAAWAEVPRMSPIRCHDTPLLRARTTASTT